MRVLSFVVLNFFLLLKSGESVQTSDFFPSDLTLVTWAHGANSQAALQKAFTDKVKMIEADMQMGRLIGQIGGDEIPIMAHPPAKESDLSFEDFMEQIVASNENKPEGELQGVKLDFKSIETVEPALKILGNYTNDQINFPIWLNADILKGPINSNGNPVDALTFLELTSFYRPGDTLSIGWTTSYGTANHNGGYTIEQVQEMIDLLNSQDFVSRSTPITYPLRAGIASQSLTNVMTLLNDSWDNATITLWSSENDPVDMDQLITLINTITKERCFTDLPFEVKENENGAYTIEATLQLIFAVTFVAILFS